MVDRIEFIDYNLYRKKEREVNKMTKMEITKKIENLNNREFMIMMSDRLTREDWDMLAEIKKEREELQKKLN